MIKISSNENSQGEVWDHKGKSNLVQIFISYDDDVINFVQFVYFEEGKFVLSDRPTGTSCGKKFRTIKLNYPDEFLTSLAGTCGTSPCGSWDKIKRISFGTNRGRHGPFGSPDRDSLDYEFEFELGQDQPLGGFHGTTNKYGGLESIGVYVRPLTSSANVKPIPSSTRYGSLSC